MADLKKFSQRDFDCQMKVRITPNVQNLFQMIFFDIMNIEPQWYLVGRQYGKPGCSGSL